MILLKKLHQNSNNFLNLYFKQNCNVYRIKFLFPCLSDKTMYVFGFNRFATLFYVIALL